MATTNLNRADSNPVMASRRKALIRDLLILTTVVFGCAVWANLSFVISNPALLRFIPPFEAGVDQNNNGNMRGEYYQIARALVAGKGFAHPFARDTGPTAWQPPIFPLVLAGLLWLFDGNIDALTAVRIFLQVYVLIATGILVVAVARKAGTAFATDTRSSMLPNFALAVYLAALILSFRVWFQLTLDSWFVMLALDLVIAGACLGEPLGKRKTTCLWGLIGGLVAMINPAVGLVWGVTTLSLAVGRRAWSRLALTVVISLLALAPWTIRNYLIFGRLIPVKSNLAFELYQAQCLQADGLLTHFGMHPFGLSNDEGREYARLGEMPYLDRKWAQFRDAVAKDPVDFADRVANRFLATTLRYTPTWPRGRWPDRILTCTYPLPFIAVLFLTISAAWRPLTPLEKTVLITYFCYLVPYIAISYYERYSLPLLGVKVLVVVLAMARLQALLWPLRMPVKEPDKRRIRAGAALEVAGGHCKVCE